MLRARRSAAGKNDGAASRRPGPRAPAPLLAPLLSVVPGQLFAAALAHVKGLDADRPEGLSKVTLAL
jgi:glucosamine--fructose-6-phosphate aminotransferase (isomerizing)